MSDRRPCDGGPSEAPSTRAGDGPVRKPQRFSAKLKTEVVLRLLRGEDLELLSREFAVIAARISEWRDEFLVAGALAMRSQPAQEGDEVKRLREKLGEVTMESELLREKIDRLEQHRPLARRRPRK